MKRGFRISLILLGCVAVIIGSTQLAQSANPKEVELVKSMVTHMGRSPGEHVMLEANFASPPQSCIVGVSRIFPDGSKDPSSFVVPGGKVLILTDIDAVIREDVAWAAGDAIVFSVVLHMPSTTPQTILTASAVLPSESVNSGITTVNSHSQSGALAGPGATLCLGAFWHRSGAGGSTDVSIAYLQGYLIDE